MDQLQALDSLEPPTEKKTLPSLGEGSSQRFSHVNGKDVFGVGWRRGIFSRVLAQDVQNPT